MNSVRDVIFSSPEEEPEESISLEMPQSGFSVWPLTVNELATLRGYFSFANQKINITNPFDVRNIIGNETAALKQLRFKLSETLIIGNWIDGTVFYYATFATSPSKQIEFITLSEAKTRNLPRASTYAASLNEAKWLVLHIVLAKENLKDQINQLFFNQDFDVEIIARVNYFIENNLIDVSGLIGPAGPQGDKGDKGDKGDTGTSGSDGTNGAPGDTGTSGSDGTNGAPGDTGPTGPAGPEGPAGPGAKPPPKPTGSGSTGEPTTSDTLVVFSGCGSIINQPYGSAGFAYANTNIRSLIEGAAQAEGHFNPVTEELVSAQVDLSGVSFTGFAIGSFSLSGGIRRAKFIDASGRTINVPLDEKPFDVPGFGNYYRYNATNIDLKMDPSNLPVYFDGEFARPALYVNDSPASQRDPAWLSLNLCSIVKRSKAWAGGCFVIRPDKYSIQFDATTEAIARAAGWHGAWQGGSTGAGAMAGPSHCFVAPSANFSIDFGGKADPSGGFANYTNWRTYLYGFAFDGSGNPGERIVGQDPGGIVYDLDVNWSPTQLRHSIMAVAGAVPGQGYVIQARNLDGSSDSGPAQFLYAEITIKGPTVTTTAPTGIKIKNL